MRFLTGCILVALVGWSKAEDGFLANDINQREDNFEETNEIFQGYDTGDNGNLTSELGYDYGNVIKFHHSGAYIAKFWATWTEDGRDMSWGKNGRAVTAGFGEEVTMKTGSTNVHVVAKEKTGLLWDMWRTVFDFRNVPVVPYREFTIYGTTLSPHYRVQPGL